MTPLLIFQVLFIAYLVSVVAFIISENRTPKSSFAWMLMFLLLPMVGLIIYLLVGRGHQAFVRKYQVTEQSAPEELADLGALLVCILVKTGYYTNIYGVRITSTSLSFQQYKKLY